MSIISFPKGYTCRCYDPPEHFATRGELRRHQIDVHTMSKRPDEEKSFTSFKRDHPYANRARRGRGGRPQVSHSNTELNPNAMLDLTNKIADSIAEGK